MDNLLIWRMGVFVGLAAVLLMAERIWARRVLPSPTARVPNLLLFAVDSVVTRVLVAITGVGVAAWATGSGFGLFNTVDAPVWIAGIVCFLLLDLAVWAQHVVTHGVPTLWRLHAVHHADEVFDVTTGVRFHPVEIILSMLWKGAVVALLGAPVIAVLVFEIVLNAGAMFSHSNLALPRGLDRVLRWGVVTPDMHRVHHSPDRAETDSNYGFFLPWWDRMFGTYVARPAAGLDRVASGLRGVRSTSLRRMLTQPFRDAANG